ncbi:hypothetical protein ACFVKB_38940 [Rhodococcus sp. NPDC127530]|uniref:hypothetical protein n=1 Tax=unclassified Rhodococcus (in: high G+C Gram-positive bacteria) TaxID=192944 RepID=UPI00362CCD89
MPTAVPEVGERGSSVGNHGNAASRITPVRRYFRPARDLKPPEQGAELGSSVPTESLYIETPKTDSLDEILSDWMQLKAPLLPIEAGAHVDGVTAR